MQPVRLELYYNYLGNFDFADKQLQTSRFVVFTPKLTVLNIQSKSGAVKNIALKGLILEVLGNKRFFIKKTGKIFSRNLFFESTLRKKNLFLFLDNCLNTIFLCKHKISNLDNISMEDKFYFYLNSNLINYFILTSDTFKYSAQLYKVHNLPEESNSWLFYLIPTTKLSKIN